jgi:hypothetical protein
MSLNKIIDNKDLLMISLSKYYSNKDTISSIIPIIQGKSSISLRLIDWFVTNYSKKFSIIITHTQNHNVIHFNVYLSYRSQLKAYSKQQFDPFKRRERIKFFYDKQNSIESTVGQLNFFRWILQNNILDYIVENLADIEKDMISSQKDNLKKKTDEDFTKKRQELSKSCIKNMNKFNGIRTIKFD